MSVFVCPPQHKHAETSTCYTAHRCRCDECRRRNTEYAYWRNNRIQHGRVMPESVVDSTGSRRRLQALMVMGWSGEQIARHCHAGYRDLWRWTHRPNVTRVTAARIRAVYDALWDQQPPQATRWEKISVTRTRNYARQAGWAPPLGWDDDTIDDPAAEPATGDGPVAVDEIAVQEAVTRGGNRLNPSERRVVVRRLNDAGWSAREISEWIDCSAKTVERIRAELGLQPHYPRGERRMKTDAELLAVYDDAWNALPFETPPSELERVALRAVYEAGRADG